MFDALANERQKASLNSQSRKATHVKRRGNNICNANIFCLIVTMSNNNATLSTEKILNKVSAGCKYFKIKAIYLFSENGGRVNDGKRLKVL
jgi:hypothetical protein